MSTPKSRVWAECAAGFGITSDWVIHSPSLTKRIDSISLVSVSTPEFMARVYHSTRRRLTVEVSEGLISDVFGMIRSCSQTIVEALTKPSLQLGARIEIDEKDALNLVAKLALSFVLQHELFHALCGHLDYKLALRRKDRAFSEFALAVADDGSQARSVGAPADELARFSYYMEFEADDSALAWMVDRLAFEEIDSIVKELERAEGIALRREDTAPIHYLSGSARILSFRLLIIAVWCTIDVVEQHRSQNLQSRSHPYPASRFLSAMSTMMAWYAFIDKTSANRLGEQVVKLTDENLGGIGSFVQDVLRPALVPFAGLAAPAIYSTAGLSVIDLAKDIGFLFLGKTPESPAGKQLGEIEQARDEYRRILSEHRYLRDMLASEQHS